MSTRLSDWDYLREMADILELAVIPKGEGKLDPDYFPNELRRIADMYEALHYDFIEAN